MPGGKTAVEYSESLFKIAGFACTRVKWTRLTYSSASPSLNVSAVNSAVYQSSISHAICSPRSLREILIFSYPAFQRVPCSRIFVMFLIGRSNFQRVAQEFVRSDVSGSEEKRNRQSLVGRTDSGEKTQKTG